MVELVELHNFAKFLLMIGFNPNRATIDIRALIHILQEEKDL